LIKLTTNKVKLIDIAAGIAVIIPSLYLYRAVTYEACLLFAVAILFYGVVRYFNSVEPASALQLKELNDEVKDLKAKIGYISIKVGFNRE